MYPSYRLTLADGFDVQITAGDAAASKVVDLLARAMMLGPGDAEHSLRVLTGQKSEMFRTDGKTIVCGFPSPVDQEDIAVQAMQVGLSIAHETQKRGGILVHGGFAELHGQGVILAAPGGTGKTTASTRLPAPWNSLCDDAALICRDADGKYFAHPWPTWSRFYFGGMGGAWNTGCAIPLKALCFLSQSPDDVLEDLNSSQAAAMLIESVEQANRVFSRTLLPSDIHENHRQQFSIVCELADRLPVHRLQLSLTGKFWSLIEESLNHPRSATKVSVFGGNMESGVSEEENSTPFEVVLSGTSMYPTLKEPGFLEVRPYNSAKPRRGDVICFRTPGSGKMVIHRVMAVRPEGLITRGDNIPHNDPDVIPLFSVVGKVDAIRKGRDGALRVRGGAAGMLDYAYAQLFRRTRMLAGRMCRLILSPNFPLGCLRFFAPRSTRFKYVYFGSIPLGRFKILSSNTCIGHYLRGNWHIAYPWRFWIDPAKVQSASQQLESAEEQWLKTHLGENLPMSVVHEPEGRHASEILGLD
jgi:signal peptidase I